MRRSTTDIAWFWDTVLRGLDIEFYKPYSQVVDLSDGKPWARWCVGGEMNIVHNLLDKYADTQIDKKLAIKSEIEDGTTRELTYKELRDQVDRMANSLRTLELGKGDAIGVLDRKSTRLNSSHTVISTLSLHDALPILRGWRNEYRSQPAR